MDLSLLIVAIGIAFYVPSIFYFSRQNQSWLGVLVFGLVVTAVAMVIEAGFPFFGVAAYTILHLVMIGMGIYGEYELRRNGGEGSKKTSD